MALRKAFQLAAHNTLHIVSVSLPFSCSTSLLARQGLSCMKSRLFTCLILLLAPFATLHAAAAKSSKPNFIVILSDDQSWMGTAQRLIPGNPDAASASFRATVQTKVGKDE